MKPPYKIVALSIFVVLNFISCKTDSSKPLSPIETQYFKDYNPPKYKWGFIDKSGESVIEPIYDDLRDPKQKLIAANLKGKWGYINLKGELRIPHRFKQALDFNGFRSFVQDFDNNWILINEDGDSLQTLSFTNFRPYKDGYSIISQANKFGTIDDEGLPKIKAIYSKLDYLYEGLFIARLNKVYGIIDQNEQTVLDFEFEKIFKSKSDLIRIKKNGKFGFYNSKTKKFSSFNFDKCFDFDGNLALVKQNGKYLAIDKNFKVVSKYDYTFMEPIDNHFIKYKSDGKLYGIIDYEGNVLAEPKFKLLNRYKSGMIVYSNNDLFGYLDSLGKIIIPPILPLAWDYHGDMARIIAGNGIGFINKEGKLVTEDKFYEVRDFNNEIARYQSIR